MPGGIKTILRISGDAIYSAIVPGLKNGVFAMQKSFRGLPCYHGPLGQRMVADSIPHPLNHSI